MNLTKNNLNLYFFFIPFLTLTFFNLNCYSQESLYGGIEIGSKGIKMSIVEIYDKKNENFTVKDYWSENIGIAKNIAIDGTLGKEDIEKAGEVVSSNLKKFKEEFKIPLNHIYIVASSGVGMAKNTEELKTKIKETTSYNLEFIDAQTEGKLLLKRCIPKHDYNKSFVLDIGGGNTKGGFVSVLEKENSFNFLPLSFNYGTVTLTEAALKTSNKNDVKSFNNALFSLLPSLREQIKLMYNSNPQALEKEKIYMSGGAVWAFYTLYNGTIAKEEFNEFKLHDVIMFDAMVKNEYSRFEELAKTDKEVERVLKTYSQKYLMSASNLLMVCLEAIPEINDKTLYFAKQNQVAWLVSYITEYQ